MKIFAILTFAAVGQATFISPYSGYGLPFAGYGLPYAGGYNYGPLQPHYIAAPIAAPIAVPIAVPIAAAPIAPAATPSSQFHAQDEAGNFNYGYSNINSAKHEFGNSAINGGVVSGSYSYVDANGQLQVTNYVADSAGFRVQATNLPTIGEVAALKQPIFEPEPLEDTAEVAAAKAEFRMAFEKAAAAAAAAEPSRKRRSAPTAVGHPLSYGLRPFAGYNTHPYASYAHPYASYAHPYAYPTNIAAAAAASRPHLGGYALPYGVQALPYGVQAAYSSIDQPQHVSTVAAPIAVAAAAAPAPTRPATLTRIQLNPGHAVAYKVE